MDFTCWNDCIFCDAVFSSPVGYRARFQVRLTCVLTIGGRVPHAAEAVISQLEAVTARALDLHLLAVPATEVITAAVHDVAPVEICKHTPHLNVRHNECS